MILSSPTPTALGIIKTIAYFDLFDYPLTAVEVYKWLFEAEANQEQVSGELDRLVAADVLATQDGFYFFSGKNNLVATRLVRYNLAETKFAVALRACRVIRWIPFVRFVGVCNNVAFNNGAALSDIDFFIIARAGRLWLARLLVTLAVSALGIRRHGTAITNRVCLSFYIADSHLSLDDIALKPADVYLVYWLATLTPIFDRDNTYAQLLQENQVILNTLPNFYPTTTAERRTVQASAVPAAVSSGIETVLSPIAGVLERLAKKVQLKKMEHNTTSVAAEPNTKVVISDIRLKFHETDRRELYLERWQFSIKL